MSDRDAAPSTETDERDAAMRRFLSMTEEAIDLLPHDGGRSDD